MARGDGATTAVSERRAGGSGAGAHGQGGGRGGREVTTHKCICVMTQGAVEHEWLKISHSVP